MKKIVVIAVFLSFFLSAIGCGGKKAVWSINVEGAKDKTVEFTSKDFEKLSTVDVDAVLKKSDGTQQKQKWTGVLLSKALESMGAKDFSKVTVEAKDGYKKEYTPELVKDSGTILAIKADGKELGDSGPVELVVSSQSGNMWIKNVVKITVSK